MPGTLYVVATPIGNLEDVTMRALRVLREVALIAAEDTRRTAHLLARYAIATPTTSLHEHNEARKTPGLVERLVNGDSIALVSDAGTPLISDPGRQLIIAATAAGIRIEPVPGPSAVMAALSVAGASDSTFSFLGFPPNRGKDRDGWFERLSGLRGTIVFFEAPHRIRRTLEQLRPLVGERPVTVGRELTKVHESVVKGPISEVIQALGEPRGELTVVIELGYTTDNMPSHAASAETLLAELCQITNYDGLSRRSAIIRLARRHEMSPNAVYAAIERAKKLVE
jgi:16S rRNA (cytidine1402-2'-O)-methyltransferase